MNIELTKNEQKAIRALLDLPPDTMCQMYYDELEQHAEQHDVEDVAGFVRKAWSLGFGDSEFVFPGRKRETILAAYESEWVTEPIESESSNLAKEIAAILEKLEETHGRSSTMLNFAYLVETLVRQMGDGTVECRLTQEVIAQIIQLHVIAMDFVNHLTDAKMRMEKTVDIRVDSALALMAEVFKTVPGDIRSILLAYNQHVASELRKGK